MALSTLSGAAPGSSRVLTAAATKATEWGPRVNSACGGGVGRFWSYFWEIRHVKSTTITLFLSTRAFRNTAHL